MLVKKDISYNLMSANNTSCSTFLFPPIKLFFAFFCCCCCSSQPSFFGKYLFMYLTVVGLSFSTQELCGIICDLLSQCVDSSCGAWTQQLHHVASDAPRCVGSQFPDQEARNRTHIDCITGEFLTTEPPGKSPSQFS